MHILMHPYPHCYGGDRMEYNFFFDGVFLGVHHHRGQGGGGEMCSRRHWNIAGGRYNTCIKILSKYWDVMGDYSDSDVRGSPVGGVHR
jgi:hypothetical protein